MKITPQSAAMKRRDFLKAGAAASTSESLGERGILTARLKSQDLTILTLPDQTFRKAQPLWIHCPLEHMHFFSKETGKRIHVDALSRRLSS